MEKNLSRFVRKFVFDHFLEHGRPPVLEEIMRKFGLGRREAFDVLKELEAARHLLLLRGTQRILMAWPFSAIPTPFGVTVHKGKYFANCSWDSIAFRAMLDEDVQIDSFCHHCGEPLGIELGKDGRIAVEPEGVLVYIGIPAAKWWDDIANTCSNNMVFFSSERHQHDWRAANPGQNGASLTVPQTLALSVPIYKDKMKLDYARPSRDQLTAHFESMGLRGDFWKI